MPDKTVLVVDDSAVNLKLADILLRKAGFTVHTVESAEAALRVLGTMLPDLMLVDIQLRGMDGLELTRRTKQDPRTQSMVVLALTASNRQEDRDRAAAAGCAGYITKPIDTRTFVAQVRSHFEVQAQPAVKEAAQETPPSALPGGLCFTSVELESLRRRFLEEGLLQSREMLADLAGRLDTDKARQLAHRWIGSAGALGYAEISSACRDLENELSLPSPNAEVLRGRLTNLALAFTHPREAEIGPLPEFITNELTGKRIGLVDFDAEEAERLCSVLGSIGALPRMFSQSEPPLSDAIRVCHAILLHVRAASPAAGWLAEGAPEPFPPVVLVGARDSVLALHPTIQARASEFLIDIWQPEEALMRIRYAISRAHPGRVRASSPSAPANESVQGNWRVLIADDDEIVVSRLRSVLEALGMKCWTASTGFEAQALISSCEPDAAVIDVNMPGKNGFEILTDVRNAGLPMRVLLLTASGGEENVIKGFSLGADDYVVKPFSPPEVGFRLRRMLASGRRPACPLTSPEPKVSGAELTTAGSYQY